jgi:hypothetical protein
MLRLRSPWPALSACVPLALLLIAFGCDQDETSCPQVCQGRIEGYVLGGEGPVRSRVGAYAFEGENVKVAVMGDTDSTGRYELSVPRGEFVLVAETYDSCVDVMHSDNGITLEQLEADTITVGETPVRVDLLGGGLTLVVDLPPAADDDYVVCYVESRSDFGHEVTCQTSHDDGHWVFEYPLLPAGAYATWVRFSDREYWFPHGDHASAGAIEVLAGQTTTRAIRIPSPGYILGSVLGSWQAIDGAPFVTAFRTEGDELAGTRVDATGAFSLEIFSPGLVRLRVDGNGPPLWVGGEDFAHATVFEVDSAETISGVSVVESGILCQLEGPPEEELDYCAVSLWDGDGTLLLEDRALYGNPVPICNLTPGSYRLKTAPHYGSQHWLPQFYDGADSLSAATSIVISTEGEVVPVALHLRISGWITGRVFRSDGAGAGRASVFISPADDISQISIATQSHEFGDVGAFTIPHLRTGDYRVGARIGSALATWYPGTADWDSAGVIHVVEGSEVSGIEWQLIE